MRTHVQFFPSDFVRDLMEEYSRRSGRIMHQLQNAEDEDAKHARPTFRSDDSILSPENVLNDYKIGVCCFYPCLTSLIMCISTSLTLVCVTIWCSLFFFFFLKHESQIIFESPSFPISIEFQREDILNNNNVPERLQMTVSDSDTIRSIRDRFLLETQEALDDEDKLTLNGRTLDEDVPVYKYKLTVGSILVLERSDTSERHHYLCADCGSDVYLKPKDAVRCRECGFRIVYKTRIPTSCHYLAR